MDRNDLKVLTRILRKHVRSQLDEKTLTIHCTKTDDGGLGILAQHPVTVIPDPQEILQTLENAVRSVKPEILAGHSVSEGSEAVPASPGKRKRLKVKLYLRTEGQKQPYAFHGFVLELPTGSPVPNFGELNQDSLKEAIQQLMPQIADADQEPPQDLAEALSSQAPTPQKTPASKKTQTAVPKKIRPLTETPTSSVSRSRARPFFQNSKPLWLSLAAGGLLLILAPAVGYGLSRPCVVGRCERLELAHNAGRAATDNLKIVADSDEIAKISEQLRSVIPPLEGIPLWSLHYREAQSLKQNYQAQISWLEQVNQAQQEAVVAAEKGLEPTSLKEWEEVQRLSLSAIARLKKIPNECFATPLIQQRLKFYQDNQSVIEQRFALERKAIEQLTKAKAAAQTAESRQATAKTTQDWQQISGAWQTAVNELRQVPQNTRTYQKEVRGLLLSYEDKLKQVQNRKNQEEPGARAFRQAQNYAEAAQDLEQQNQLSQAASRWRNALSTAQSISADSADYERAQSLIGTYAASLQRVEERIQSWNQAQRTRSDLEQTCSGSPQLCTYTIQPDLLQVQLTQEYWGQVMRAAIDADIQADIQVQGKLQAHLQKVKAALEIISDNAGIPMQLYEPNGSLLGQHRPRR